MESTDLCAIPAGVSPDGVYDFIDPPSLGPAVIAVGVVLCVISTTMTAGRLYNNRNMMHSADCKPLFASEIRQASIYANTTCYRLYTCRLFDKHRIHRRHLCP
jgi:hypothetical protein